MDEERLGHLPDRKRRELRHAVRILVERVGVLQDGVAGLCAERLADPDSSARPAGA